MLVLLGPEPPPLLVAEVRLSHLFSMSSVCLIISSHLISSPLYLLSSPLISRSKVWNEDWGFEEPFFRHNALDVLDVLDAPMQAMLLMHDNIPRRADRV
jgi:hypothetical protein